MKIYQLWKDRWKSWRESSDPEEIIRGPWNHWRRSLFLLSAVFLLFAFLPWIFEAPPLRETSSPEEIFQSGRVGEPVLWGSTLFFHPASPDSPRTPQEVFRFRGQSPILLPLRGTGREVSSLPGGELARFGDSSWSRGDIVRLARSEARLSGDRLSRDLLYLILRRKIEEAWLVEEGSLQGLSIEEEQIDRLLRNHPQEVSLLRSAGFNRADIRERTEGLLLASAIRNILPPSALARFEGEWVQRWRPRTRCQIELPLCVKSQKKRG